MNQYKHFQRPAVGIEIIKDVLDENHKFLGFEFFCRKTGLKPPFTKFYGLISAIPNKWKRGLGLSVDMNSHQTEKTKALGQLFKDNLDGA